MLINVYSTLEEILDDVQFGVMDNVAINILACVFWFHMYAFLLGMF